MRNLHFQMTEHLQSAYKANNSTETALLKVREDILQAIDHREVTCLVLLDLSAAFDTVDHQLSLNRHKHSIWGSRKSICLDKKLLI